MRKLLLSVLGVFAASFMFAQTYTYVDVNQISFVDSTSLANCNDSSVYLGDTVVTRGIVVTDGNLSEVSSSSITGGSRPFIAIVDTANDGSPGAFKGAVIMGADPTSNPVSDIENAIAGDIIEITAIITAFNGLVQLQPLDANAVSVVGATTAPSYVNLSAGMLQDAQRQNILPTGEQWEGSYVELENMTVVNVSVFSGGSRCEFTVRDTAGNQVLVADRFLPMRLDGVNTVNPNSPKSTGTLMVPAVGTVFKHIRGIIFQDENGCAGGSSFAGGYEINPFDSTDFDIDSFPPPSIADVRISPTTVSDTDTVVVSAEIFDIDGMITGATLYYSGDPMAMSAAFTAVPMVNTTGDEYTATIRKFGRDTIVRYYIEATDDSSFVSTAPYTQAGKPLNTYDYEIMSEPLTIMDIQMVTDINVDASTYVGQRVTVTGFATGSYQTGDLGYLYIQDTSAAHFSGIYIEGGPASILTINRGDEVTVTGCVEENFGFTQIDADTVFTTGNSYTVQPIVVDPSNADFFGASADSLEVFEGVLLRYENPNGKVFVNDTTLNFAEYTVGSGKGATNTARILAGRQVDGQAQGSLDVSYINDTATYGSALNVPAVQVDTNFSMDYIDGILFYAFGNYKLTPRNNSDFSNLIVSIETIEKSNVSSKVYPNPASNLINVQIDQDYNFAKLNIQILDMTGRVVLDRNTSNHLTELNLISLEKGIYIMRIANGDELINSSKLILK